MFRVVLALPIAGRTIYEWEQSLEEVNLYIEAPPGLRAESIDCKITPKHIRLGVKGNPPFIDVRCWVTAYEPTKNNIPPPPFPPSLAPLSSLLIPLPSSSRKRQNVLYVFERALTYLVGNNVGGVEVCSYFAVRTFFSSALCIGFDESNRPDAV